MNSFFNQLGCNFANLSFLLTNCNIFRVGFFLSTAMFGSILSVTYLGQGIGNSIIQAKIIVR